MTTEPLPVVNAVSVYGLGQPLVDVASVLHVQGNPHHAMSLRNAAWVCEQVGDMPDVVERLKTLKEQHES